MEPTDHTLLFSADNAYNTTLHSPSSPDQPLYSITSNPGIDSGSTAFTAVTKGESGEELARWIWRARWRGDLLTYAGGKAVKATSWIAERGWRWKVAEESGEVELFAGKDTTPLARFVSSAPATSEPARLHLLGEAADDQEIQDAIVVSFFLQERFRREKQWAGQAGKVDGGRTGALASFSMAGPMGGM
ncbi:unnamed protein product [Peniophora sp. CBMAI 1063]|nr:unnamed protein product [Peniophora sp. CBMAI 1063]